MGRDKKKKNTGQYTGIMQVVWSEIMAWINVVFGENRAKFKKKTGFHPRQAWDKGTFISNHNNIQTHSQQWDK